MNHCRDMFFLLLFIMMTTLFWQPVLQATVKAGGRDIIIYYSNDVHGETEPCG
jgi:hypothetical protein